MDLSEPHSEPLISAKLSFNGMERTEAHTVNITDYFIHLKNIHLFLITLFIHIHSGLKPESNDPMGVL